MLVDDLNDLSRPLDLRLGLVAAAFEHRDARVLGEGAVDPRALAEREDRAAAGPHEALEAARVAQPEALLAGGELGRPPRLDLVRVVAIAAVEVGERHGQ